MVPSHGKALLTLAATAVFLAAPVDAAAQVKPALTRDVSTAQPVSTHCADSYNTGNYFVRCPLYTVPAGKRLVVEVVSYRVTFDSAIQPTQLMFGLDSLNSANFLFGNKVRQITPVFVYNSGSYRTYAGSEMTRIYLEENERLAGIVYFSALGSNYIQEFNFSGYLVDK